MKKLIVIAGSFLVMTTLASTVFADTAMPAAMNKAKPCKNIRAACTAAGYVKGNKNGKALMMDCVKPILMGQQVDGVNVNPNDVQACQAKIAKMKKAGSSKMMQQQPPAQSN